MLKDTARLDSRIEEAYADFLSRYPSYRGTSALDALRATEYRRLDEQRQVYLDYTGGSLHGESQIGVAEADDFDSLTDIRQVFFD